SYYLYSSQEYWTMSPSSFSNFYAFVLCVHFNNGIESKMVSGSGGLRPVINLKADVTITGSGTENDPYEVS
ncbi:MAG: hypothetical protein K2J20_02540, partial [Bacilli bacterium]|nr:hypothetical protein [Bacilli bacterium]